MIKSKYRNLRLGHEPLYKETKLFKKYNYRGYWKVKFEFWVEGRDDVFDLEDLSEISQEHIIDSIKQGYTSGEINEPDDKKENKQQIKERKV